jgi:hypothetical protein
MYNRLDCGVNIFYNSNGGKMITGQQIMDAYYKLNDKKTALPDFIDTFIDVVKLEEYTKGYNAGMEFAERLAPLMQERRENANQVNN